MAALTQAETYTQAGREPRSNPSTGENGSREGQVVHRCSSVLGPTDAACSLQALHKKVCLVAHTASHGRGILQASQATGVAQSGILPLLKCYRPALAPCALRAERVGNKIFMLAPQRQRGLTFHKSMHAAKTILCASEESEARSNFQRTFQSTSFPPSQPALVQTEGQSRWGNPSGLSQSLNQKAKGSWVHKEKHGMT